MTGLAHRPGAFHEPHVRLVVSEPYRPHVRTPGAVIPLRQPGEPVERGRDVYAIEMVHVIGDQGECVPHGFCANDGRGERGGRIVRPCVPVHAEHDVDALAEAEVCGGAVLTRRHERAVPLAGVERHRERVDAVANLIDRVRVPPECVE